jgi:hypothetical protein
VKVDKHTLIGPPPVCAGIQVVTTTSKLVKVSEAALQGSNTLSSCPLVLSKLLHPTKTLSSLGKRIPGVEVDQISASPAPEPGDNMGKNQVISSE